ncbi:MAG: sensor histidine kinase, partial [Alphaproteobacteria bacterium]
MGRLDQVRRSFAAKIVVLAAIFIAVPIILYSEFYAADEEKNRLLLESVEAQGRLAAETLRPLVASADGQAMRAITQTVLRLGGSGSNIKLLYRPAAGPSNQSFFYVASSPAVSAQYLDEERQDLLSAGVLDRLKDSCEEVRALAVRYINPAGGQELLTSITPIRASTGCWAVITSNRTAEFLGSSLAKPYWQTDAVELAAAIYLVMAAIVA